MNKVLKSIILALMVVKIYSRELENMARVIEGQIANQKNWYFMVSMYARPRDYEGQKILFAANCGGVIVNKWHILTAAHCLYDRKPKDVVFSAGSTNITRVLEPQGKTDLLLDKENIYIFVESLILYPNFVKATLENDIGVARVHKPLKFDSENIGLIPLETLEQEPKGTKIILI